MFGQIAAPKRGKAILQPASEAGPVRGRRIPEEQDQGRYVNWPWSVASAGGQPLARLTSAFLEIHDGVDRGLFPRLAFARQPINLNPVHRFRHPQTEMNPGSLAAR